MSKRRKQTTDFDVKNTNSERNRKNTAVFLVLVLILSGVGVTSAYWLAGRGGGGILDSSGNGESGGALVEVPTTRYRNVIGELFVTTTCPYCVKAEDDLAAIESERDDFHFVTFVADANEEAYARYNEISKRQGTPDTEFDGGRVGELGAVDSASYVKDIEYCKNVGVPEVIVGGRAYLTDSGISFLIRLSVNSGTFSGQIRAFVIEKASRYLNVRGEPIPNAFVGYAVIEEFSVSASNSYFREGVWTGDVANPDNMAILVAIYDEEGYGIQAYRIDV